MAKGRPRKSGAKRTASGRLSRAAGADQENLDPIHTRMRVFGLSEQDARDQKAATYIGRLCLAGRKANADGITEAQYEAASVWKEAYEGYQRAVKSPDALRSGVGGGDQGENDRYAARCQAAIAKFDGIRDAVRAEQCLHENKGANMWAALDYLVGRDQQLPHMVGDLRLALNAIGHHMGMMQRPKSKPVDRSPQIAA